MKLAIQNYKDLKVRLKKYLFDALFLFVRFFQEN